MRRLSSLIGFMLGIISLMAQSPHGVRLKMDCADCHSPEGWAIAATQWHPAKRHTGSLPDTAQGISTRPVFEHSSTGFNLDGQHAHTNCRECHPTLVFSEAKPTCVSCHVDLHQQTVGVDCARCHTSVNWQVNRIADIHEASGFPLIGVHAVVQCRECHTGENPMRFDRRDNTCVGCHLEAFQNAKEPNHVQLGLTTECGSCHSIHSPDWRPASFTFAHNAYYVLDGAHAAISHDCAACHVGSQYSNTPNTCAGCHTDDFNRTTNPNHVTAKFDTDCASCHATSTWAPATFDHDLFYPLKGAHKAIQKDCAACHIGAQYSNTPNTCAGCHLTDYNQTKNPNHITARFPISCADCHSETAWEPSTFNHDSQYFPIYSGEHKGEWAQCIECHTTPGNFAVFNCLECHEHNNANALAGEHRGVRRYEYVSTACYSCHPKGN